jgi:hypothetical protein
MFDLQNPMVPLTLATVLLVVVAIDMPRDRRRPLWLRFAVRIGVFAVLTWLMQMAVGSPMAPQVPDGPPGERVWIQLVEIGWWMTGARVAAGILRLVVILENRPRETRIVSDLLAGTCAARSPSASRRCPAGSAVPGPADGWRAVRR